MARTNEAVPVVVTVVRHVWPSFRFGRIGDGRSGAGACRALDSGLFGIAASGFGAEIRKVRSEGLRSVASTR